MFDRNDFNDIDSGYFSVITKTCFHIILKSKNTGHIWDIYCCSPSPKMRKLKLYHKHSEAVEFHEQSNAHPHSVAEALEMIQKHDIWHMNGRK